MAAGLDVAIRGATMIDGLGGPAKHVDVGIKDGLIDTVGDLSGRRAGEEVQAEGQVLAPGFVDVHTHDDFAALLYPEMAFKLRGGVTTCVVGNCGFGAAPFVEACVLGKAMHPDLSVSPYEGYAGYMARLDEQPPGVNISVLAGHGTLRLAAMGTADRAPDDREM
ncbi:MAG: amidohydrolase family protein, partial [Pseudomonadota bacterium]